MIYFNSKVINNIKDEYTKFIVPKIQNNINKVKYSKLSKKSKQILNFFKCPMKKGAKYDRFIEKLITTSVEDLCKEYTWINDYVYISKLYTGYYEYKDLFFHKNFRPSNDEYKLMRKDYVERYCKNIINIHTKSVIEKYKTESDYEINENNFRNFLCKVSIFLDDYNKIFHQIIDYNNIDDNLRHKIINNFNISVCPYCNRQYITTYKVWEKEIRVTADVEHFLPKENFPLFALTLYNFIPSCLVCNRSIKSRRYIDMWNPYIDGFNNIAYFDIDIEKGDINSLVGENTGFSIRIVYDESVDKESIYLAQNTIHMFRIEELYKAHKDHVRELLYKKYAINNTYLKGINELFEKEKLTEEESNLFTYGQTLKVEDFNKRPLSKLAYDLIKRK